VVGAARAGRGQRQHYEHDEQPHVLVLDVDYERRRHCARRWRAVDRLRRRPPEVGFRDLSTGNPQKALKLSECMRANGVPNFPDPNGQGVIQGSGIDPNSPQFQKAQQTCAKQLGGGAGTRSPAQIARAEAAALAFSKCMRSHGVPDLPDPQFSSGGGISIRITGHAGGGNNGLDPNSPIFQKAQQTCGSLLPGRAGGKLAP
jgi:hypothetical protein